MCRVASTIAVVIVNTAIAAPVSNGGTGGKLNYYESAKKAVCHYFGPNCSLAMKIVKCETGGTYYPWASNGQYLGIFQMGSRERAIYGHGNNVWAQAKAAYRYFRDAGWHPWLDYEPPGCAA